MLVTISLYAQKKLNCLELNCRKKFLKIIYNLITNQLSGDQAKKLVGQNKLIRIRYNLNQRIIASIIEKEPETQIRILDFVSHQKMDTDQYYKNIKSDYEILDLEATLVHHPLNSLDQDVKNTISEASLWQNYDDFENLRTSNQVEDDFYIYCVDNDGEKTADLSLSSQQYQITEAKLPIFLAGSAGSGKTTIALYHALKKSLEIKRNGGEKKIVYVTYNRHLKEYGQKIITSIYDFQEVSNLKLFDYQSLCHSLGINTQHFPLDKYVSASRFIKEFFQTRTHQIKRIEAIMKWRPLGAIALWQEIRHLLKGSIEASKTEERLISEADYYKYSQTKFGENSQFVYQLAREYQIWLKTQKYWDEIDLTYTLMENRPQESYEYDFLYCDEIQDLTEIQINFLLQLLRPPSEYQLPNFLFAGDAAQIINPSGFSWDKVKNILYDNYQHLPKWGDVIKTLDAPQYLALNFRSSAAIVELSNKILTFIQTKPVTQASFRSGGNKPVLISGISDKELLEGRNIFGPNNVIITVSEEEKEKLSEHFTSNNIKAERILAISEVKGLEYEQVLVWNFFSQFNTWVRQTKKEIQELENFKYNCLYVCITRARDNLYFFEETPQTFWQKPEIANCLSVTNKVADMSSFFNPDITSLDWKKSGQDLEEQGAYLQAKENYLRGGWDHDVMRIEAKLFHQEGNYQKAAEIWEALGYMESAIEAWEYIQNYEKIAIILEKNLEFERAGQMWEKVLNYQKAAEVYEKIQAWAEMERCGEKANNWVLVAFACEKQDTPEKWLKSAQIWEQNLQLTRAAACYEQVPVWEKAEVCWRLVGDWLRIAYTCEKQNKWLEAAIVWGRNGNPKNAADCCETGEYWLQAAQYWQESGEVYRIALMYHRCAGKTWENLGELEKAARAYEEGEYWSKAEQLWRELNYKEKLAQIYEKQGKWQQAGLIWMDSDIQTWEKAGNAWEKAGEFMYAAAAYECGEYWSKAEVCWQQDGNKEREAIACERQGKWTQAAVLWTELKKWQKAAVAYQNLGDFENAAIMFENGNFLTQAKDCWLSLNRWERVALLCEALGLYFEAGRAWEEVPDQTKAAKNYRRCCAFVDEERCWQDLDQWENVAIACEQQNRSEKWLKAASIWKVLAKKQDSYKLLKRAEQAYKQAYKDS